MKAAITLTTRERQGCRGDCLQLQLPSAAASSSRYRAGDRDEAAVGRVLSDVLRRVVWHLYAPKALVVAVASAREVVQRVAAVEVGHPVHRVVVLGAVRVVARHLGDLEARVHGEGSV